MFAAKQNIFTESLIRLKTDWINCFAAALASLGASAGQYCLILMYKKNFPSCWADRRGMDRRKKSDWLFSLVVKKIKLGQKSQDVYQ